MYLSTRVVVMAARPGRLIEEVTIDEPYPRGPEFRVSTAFSRYAKRLQDSLLRASGTQAERRAGMTPLLARPEFQRIFYPALVAVLLIGLWQWWVTAFEIPKFLVPSPLAGGADPGHRRGPAVRRAVHHVEDHGLRLRLRHACWAF